MSWVYAAADVLDRRRCPEVGAGPVARRSAAAARRRWDAAASVGPYGYGWQVLAPSAQTLRRPLVLHAGGLNSFATDLLRYPGEDLTVVILANLGTVPLPRIAAI